MTINVQIIKKQLIAENIVHLTLASSDGNALPEYEAGSHIDLHIDGDTIRQYSLLPSDNSSHYEIAILKEQNGRGGSVKVHEHLKTSDHITISKPRNNFPLEGAEHSLLIAGGIGITPILAMAEELSSKQASFELHYCSRSKNNAAFYERIQQSPYNKQSHCYFDDLDLSFNSSVLEQPTDDKRIFVCGPEGFINFIRETASNLGWPEDRVHFELFQKSENDDTGHGATFKIKIADTDQIIEVAEDETALEALERCGVDVPCSCEQGVCGTCVVNVVEGIPDHQDMYLTDIEKQENSKFTPCCSRSLSPQLIIRI